MSKKFIILCGFFPLFFTLSCNNKTTNITGTLPGSGSQTGLPEQETISTPGTLMEITLVLKTLLRMKVFCPLASAVGQED